MSEEVFFPTRHMVFLGGADGLANRWATGGVVRDPVVEKYKRFMPIAHAYAAMSKLPGTKVGCVILGPDYEVRTSGWNGAPRRSSADTDERVTEREERLRWVCHAEANAIANAARSGTPLAGTTMVVTLMPCLTCAKLAVQAGIVRVICPTTEPDMEERWSEDFTRARRLFTECGVRLIQFDTSEQ